MKNILIIVIISIIAVGLAIGYILWQDQGGAINSPDTSNISTPVTFLNVAEGTSVSVAEDVSTQNLVFNGLGFESVVMTPVEAENEERRYENSETGLTLLSRDFRVTVYAGDATIFDGYTEEVAMTMEDPVTQSSSVGKQLLSEYTWVWEKTVMNNDETITPATPGAFTLTFTPEDQLSGTTDCNSFNAPYSLEGSEIYISDIAMTRMFCENTQEAQFMNMVTTSQYVFFTEDQDLVLLLPLDSGSVIFSKQE